MSKKLPLFTTPAAFDPPDSLEPVAIAFLISAASFSSECDLPPLVVEDIMTWRATKARR